MPFDRLRSPSWQRAPCWFPGALLLAAWQGSVWWHTGAWPPLSLQMISLWLDRPLPTWLMQDRSIVWLEQDAAPVLFLVGAATLLLELRRLLHPQEHGAGPTFASPCQNTPPRTPITASWRVSGAASPTTTSTSATKLSARWSCRCLVPAVPDHVLPQWPQLHRAGAQPGADRLSQDRQRLSRGG